MAAEAPIEWIHTTSSDDNVHVIATDDGCRLWVADTGQGLPVVLCHGGPGLWDMFAPLAEPLSERVRVIRWDQRGCGRSEQRGPYSVSRSVADLDAVRSGLGLERMVVAGHSWGAALALRYALDHPERVSALVYMSGTGLGWAWREPFHRDAAERLAPHQHRMSELRARERSPAEDREFAILQWSADFAGSDAMSLAEQMATPWFAINWECYESIWGEMQRTWREPELIAACRTLTVPALIIDGSQDPRPRWAVDSLAQALPSATRVALPTAGHVPWLDAPDETLAALLDFLGGLSGQA
jgi:proline iminopeptidase